MTGKLHATLKGKQHATPPIWLMRQAGRYLPEYLETRNQAGSFLDLCYTPSLAAEVTLQPIRRFGFDAAILFSDILVVPQALGQSLTFAPDHGPVLGPLPEIRSLENQGESTFHVNLSPVYDAVGTIRSKLDAEGFAATDLIGFSGAPWTLACYMIDGKGTKDFMATRVRALRDPEFFARLLSLLEESITAYLVRQVEHGANVVQLFDSWAGVLSPDLFRAYVIEPTKRIVQKFKSACPDTPIIGFPRGAGHLYADYIRETGVDGVGMDTTLPVTVAAKDLQPLCTVQGNLDPALLVAGGERMDSAIDDILTTLAGRPFIFNLGHGIDQHTPPAHVERLVTRVKSWSTSS